MAKKKKKDNKPPAVTSKSAARPVLKPRNSAAVNPLLRKGHVHVKPQKTERSKDKQALRKELANTNDDA
jgi:hypothetical protein